MSYGIPEKIKAEIRQYFGEKLASKNNTTKVTVRLVDDEKGARVEVHTTVVCEQPRANVCSSKDFDFLRRVFASAGPGAPCVIEFGGEYHAGSFGEMGGQDSPPTTRGEYTVKF